MARMNAKRKLHYIDVSFISLVARPANGKPVLLKSGEPVRTFAIAKMDEEWQRVYGIVYAPDEVDTDGDTASADVIKNAADNFMRAGRTQNVDSKHSFKAEQAYVAESWIVKDGDPYFAETGAWAVGIQINDRQLWERAKAGELAGLSLAGQGYGEQIVGDKDPESDGLAKAVIDGLKKYLPTTTKDATDMDKEQVRAIAAEAVEQALAKQTADAKAAADKAEADKAAESSKADDQTDLKAQLEKAVGELGDKLGKQIDSKLAEALAKGASESGAASAEDYAV